MRRFSLAAALLLVLAINGVASGASVWDDTDTAVLSAAVVPPGAAAVDGTDFLIWQRESSSVRAIVGIRDGTSNTIMYAQLFGLQPNANHRLVGSAKGCRRTHTPADTVMQHQFQANGIGAAFVDTTFDDSALVAAITTLRVFRGTHQLACGRPAAYQTLTGGNAPTESISFGVWTGDGGNYLGITLAALDAGFTLSDDLLNEALQGLKPGTDYRLVGTDESCTEMPTSASRLFRHAITSSMKGTHVHRTAGTNLFSRLPASMHLFRAGHGRVACVNSVIIAPVTLQPAHAQGRLGAPAQSA